MKITHRVPFERHSATLTPEYQAEVDRATNRATARWMHEQNELAKVERRRDRIAARKPRTAREVKTQRKRLAEADALIELHRLHLVDLHRLMVATGAPSPNRGRKSFRPVPDPKGGTP